MSDRIFYHATASSCLDDIRRDGLEPRGDWACLPPDEEDVDGLRRVWLCRDPRGVRRYVGMLSGHGEAALLAVLGEALTDIDDDEARVGDCFVTHAVPPDALMLVSPDGTMAPLADAPTPAMP